MTDKLRAAAEAALEFAEFCWREVPLNDWAESEREAVEQALRAALAEQEVEQEVEQEPVAWVGWSDVHGYMLWDTKDEAEWMSASGFVPIPVPSPRREWQTLTEAERKQFAQWVHPDVLERVEAALKEKNHD